MYDLVLKTSIATPALLALIELELELLDEAGLTGQNQRQAYVFVTSLLDGFVSGERFRSQLEGLPLDLHVDHPRLAAFVADLQGDGPDENFEHALNRLIKELTTWSQQAS